MRIREIEDAALVLSDAKTALSMKRDKDGKPWMYSQENEIIERLVEALEWCLSENRQLQRRSLS